MTKPEAVIAQAEGHLGCPYVYGTWGQLCTPALRKRYAEYNPKQKAITYKRCPVLSEKQSKCSGCKYDGMLAFDCRGFTHYCVKQGAGIDISGGYVGRQWSDPNWDVKGTVSDQMEAVSCVFLADMSHTGLYVLNGQVIHCSGEVKTDPISGGRKWEKFAIPKGLYTWQELVKLTKGDFNRMLKKGSNGTDVRDMQIMLNSLGYDCGTADGIFGNKTVTAVKAFQAAEGLTVDGIAGPKTLEILAMRAAAPDPDPEKEPDWIDDDPVVDPSNTVTVDREALVDMINQLEAMRDQLDGMAYVARGWIGGGLE